MSNAELPNTIRSVVKEILDDKMNNENMKLEIF